MPRITVIVPVFNVENYLSACVDSVLAQTFTDFECILVDDGSPDACPALCDAYARRDARIRVIHQKNAGVSAARNAGIRTARGKWLAFVDADDYVHPRYLELLYGAAQAHHAQLACCSHWGFDEEALPGGDPGPAGPVRVLTGRQALTDHYRCAGFSFTVWDKLYARSLMEQVLFPEGLRHEDEFFHNHLLPVCDTVVILSEKLYYYRRHGNSFMRRPFSESRLDIFTVNHDAFMVCAERGYQDVLPFVAKEFWRRFHHYGRRAVKQHCLTPAWERQLLRYCRDLWNADCPPQHPLIHIFVRLFLSARSRPLLYWLYARL